MAKKKDGQIVNMALLVCALALLVPIVIWLIDPCKFEATIVETLSIKAERFCTPTETLHVSVTKYLLFSEDPIEHCVDLKSLGYQGYEFDKSFYSEGSRGFSDNDHPGDNCETGDSSGTPVRVCIKKSANEGKTCVLTFAGTATKQKK